jgi:putative membrane protein
MQLIVKLLITSIAVFVTAYILPGVHVDSYISALIVAIVLGVINAFIKPILLLLTLPITLVTLGLFTLVINALLVLLTDYLVQGFSVDNFFWAIGFSIVVSMVSWFLSRLASPATS